MSLEQRILIVEDDDLQREELVHSLLTLPSPFTIHTAKSFEEAVSILGNSIVESSYYHLFLLDIHLSQDEAKQEGFQFARLIRSHTDYKMTPLIFLTTNKEQIEFALNNFHCYNYIKKPYNSEDIAKQIEHLMLSQQMRKETFFIRDTGRIAHRIQIENILYLESNGHTLKIVCTDTTVVTRDTTLSSMEKRLGDRFFRCHKKYIVNTTMIENYDSICSNLQIASYVIPIGRVYKEKLLESIDIIKI